MDPTLRHPFHLAFPVDDLQAARSFYGALLGCKEGRSASRWIDFDFWGHQITAHLVAASRGAAGDGPTNPVDGDNVPARHFGIVLPLDEWEALRDRLVARGVCFRIEPHVRFAGEVGEQATMFIDDPSGNALEFKSFADPSRLFANETA